MRSIGRSVGARGASAFCREGVLMIDRAHMIIPIISHALAFCASRPFRRVLACCSRRMMNGRPYSSKTSDMLHNPF